jgi:hypothetical protein
MAMARGKAGEKRVVGFIFIGFVERRNLESWRAEMRKSVEDFLTDNP